MVDEVLAYFIRYKTAPRPKGYLQQCFCMLDTDWLQLDLKSDFDDIQRGHNKSLYAPCHGTSGDIYHCTLLRCLTVTAAHGHHALAARAPTGVRIHASFSTFAP
jgi:hypothetical protein